MTSRPRKLLSFILYVVIGLSFAALLYWSKSIFWSVKYQELRADLFWPFMATILVVLVVIFYRVSQEESTDNKDDT